MKNLLLPIGRLNEKSVYGKLIVLDSNEWRY